MERLVWEEEYAVGDEDIDVQHRRLIDLINTAERVVSSGRNFGQAVDILTALDRYVELHLEQEDRALRTSGAARVQAEGCQRETLAPGLKQLIEHCRKHNTSKAVSGLVWLQNWCRDHLAHAVQRSSPAPPPRP